MLKRDRPGLRFLAVFTVSMGSQAICFSVSVCLSSCCIENGRKSEKSNHVPSATLHIESE